MNSLFKNIVNELKYWFLLIVFVLIFGWGVPTANADLMWDLFRPAYNHETIITISPNRDAAGMWVFHWGTQITLKKGVEQEPSLVVKLTRYFLTFTIAISVTMILYNGFTYIIQTGRWKEWKNLVSNVVYIVVWILIALFSVIIITILQSAWTTINKTISMNYDTSWITVYNVNHESLL